MKAGTVGAVILAGVLALALGGQAGRSAPEPGASSAVRQAELPASERSLANLQRLGMALLLYTQDYNERLPPLRDPATARKLLRPYVRAENGAAAFVHPESWVPYQVNPALAGKPSEQIASPSRFVAFYEAEPAADGTRGVAFVDGRAARVTASEWAALKQASGIAMEPPIPAPDRALAEKARLEAAHAASMARLRQLAKAMRLYVLDYDEMFPPMKDRAAAQKQLAAYEVDAAAWINPETGEPYGLNLSLSRKKLFHLAYPDQMVVFYETRAATDGSRGVGCVDGEARRVQETQWPRLRRLSRLP